MIVEPRRLYRDCLARAITARGIPVSSGRDAEALAGQPEPGPTTAVLVSMAGGDDAETLRRCVESAAGSPVIAFGIRDDDEAAIILCAEAGVSGFHFASQSFDDLMTAVDQVLAGNTTLPAFVSALIVRRLSELASDRGASSERNALLTAREAEVLELVTRGQSNREIAKSLGIAIHTVKNHVHSVLTKVGARSRTEAIALHRASSMSPSESSGPTVNGHNGSTAYRGVSAG